MPISLGTTSVTALFLGTTSITSAYLGATQVFGGASAFSPADLFSSGSQGIWLDPSDLTTMFVDRAGTTPVTAPGQLVGLRLDKSKGLALGPEYVTNAADREFTSDTGFWSKEGAATISGGVVNINNASGTFPIYRFNFPNTPGGYVEIAFDLVLTAGAVNILYGSTSSQNFTTSGRVTVRMYRSAVGTLGIRAAGGGTTTGTIDNISVRELPGNHATAPTDAARPMYGVEPKGGRRNLLTWSEDASNAIWLKTGASASGQEIRETTANSGHLIFQSFSFTGSHAFSLELQAVGRDLLTVWMGTSSGTFAFQYTFSTNTISSVGSALSGVTSSVLTGGWVRLTGAVLTPNRFQVSTGAPGATYVGDPATGFNIRNAQLETGSTATAYQRVTTAYDVTESGVDACHYVQYDGSDDSMSTAAIDFTGTDKMSVFAGVRKLSDAARGMIVELSTSTANVGSIGIDAPTATSGNNYRLTSGGSVPFGGAATSPASYASPVSNIMASIADISGDLATLRLNGTQVAQGTTDQGTGNFGNYPLFFGRRNNATLPFNGKDYGIIIVGKAASAGEITDTETWLAAKTSGVTL